MKSNIFARQTVEDKIKSELERAQAELLIAETNAEYWDAQAVYNRSRIDRLKARLHENQKVCAGVAA